MNVPNLNMMIVTMILMTMMMKTMMILVLKGLAENNQGGWKATCGGRETSQEEVANISLKILNCKYLIENKNCKYLMQSIKLQISHAKY